MSGEGPGEFSDISSMVNVHVYIEILKTFLIPLIGSRFGDNEVIFQDDKIFLFRKGISTQ